MRASLMDHRYDHDRSRTAGGREKEPSISPLYTPFPGSNQGLVSPSAPALRTLTGRLADWPFCQLSLRSTHQTGLSSSGACELQQATISRIRLANLFCFARHLKLCLSGPSPLAPAGDRWAASSFPHGCSPSKVSRFALSLCCLDPMPASCSAHEV